MERQTARGSTRLKALGLVFHQLAVAIFVAAVAVPIAAALTNGEVATRSLAAAPVGAVAGVGVRRAGTADPGGSKELALSRPE